MHEADRGRVAKVVQFQRYHTLSVIPHSAPAPMPASLMDALFGDGRACYVLLDGARVLGLPSMLDRADAKAQSLFRGDSLKNFADAGPWIAQLHPGSRLLDMLFTASRAPQHLWGKVNFVLTLTRSEPEPLITHFRRYIRLRRLDGSVPLFRFWDGLVLADYFDGCEPHPQRAARFFGAQGDEPLITTFLLAGQDPAGLVPFHLAGPLPPEAQAPDAMLTAVDEQILRNAVDKRIVARVEVQLDQRFAQIDPTQAHKAGSYARGAMSFIRRFGSGQIGDIEMDCFQLALVAFLLGPSWRAVSEGPLMRETLVPISQRIALLRESYFAALNSALPQ